MDFCELFKQLDVNEDLGEKFRILVDQVLKVFILDNKSDDFIFPNTLINAQRKYIHDKAQNLGLHSKSYGKDPNRRLKISKRHNLYQRDFHLEFNTSYVEMCNEMLDRYYTSKCAMPNFGNRSQKKATYENILDGFPIPVNPRGPSTLLNFRKQLPTWSMRGEFLFALSMNQIVIVSSKTGSGKSTQIPQFILEDCLEQQRPCRIVCTQPRRLATLSVAQRVAEEWGEQLGNTIGYQIRLESIIGITSSLIYCTNGILLKSLMNNERCLENYTHVVVDEIHERDKYTDFLLIYLKKNLGRFPNLRVILMSATMDIDSFTNYFQHNKVHVIYIPGKLYPVKEYFLDDILLKVDYKLPTIPPEGDSWGCIGRFDPNTLAEPEEPGEDCQMNITLMDCFTSGSESAFTQLIQMILCEFASVNHQTPVKMYTPLIAAAMHGNVEVVEQLLHLGADTSLCSIEGLTALQWAENYKRKSVVDLLSMVNKFTSIGPVNTQQSKLAIKDLLKEYDKRISPDVINYDLILSIIAHIHKTDKRNSILVFLPGYEEIVACQDKIESFDQIDMNEFEIFILHSSLPMYSQRGVFGVIPSKQKIVLSTNIAETSITMSDVAYVIDAGLAKEKIYDSLSEISTLQTCWISKASVKQRAGRAGRSQAGECYHLFSKYRYEALEANRIPEILRVPLHELCLRAKKLAPPNTLIYDFLKMAMEPPTQLSVQSAVRYLISIGALDELENLTDLGEHLIQLSVDPKLGKMLIYAVTFKCIDPILTMVAVLSHKEPFVLPTQNMKYELIQRKQELAGGTLSDHVMLLRLFQLWQQSKDTRTEKQFCRKYFVSSGAMEMIMCTRIQLLSQLRAAGFVHTKNSLNIRTLNANSGNWPLVKACLVAGSYPNIAYFEGKIIHTKTEKNIGVYKGSACCDKKAIGATFMLFDELSKLGTNCKVRCCTAVTQTTVALICGLNESVTTNDKLISIDDWLSFYWESDLKLNLLKNAITKMVLKKVQSPHWALTAVEESLLVALKLVLMDEEEASGFKQPDFIGIPEYNRGFRHKPTNYHYSLQNLNSHRFRGSSGSGSYNLYPAACQQGQLPQGFSANSMNRHPQQFYPNNTLPHPYVGGRPY